MVKSANQDKIIAVGEAISIINKVEAFMSPLDLTRETSKYLFGLINRLELLQNWLEHDETA